MALYNGYPWPPGHFWVYGSSLHAEMKLLWSCLLKHRKEMVTKLTWTASWQNQQNGMCAQRRLRSAWAFAQSDQSSLCVQWVAKDASFLYADSKDSDQTRRMDAQADLSLLWMHSSFCRFCHAGLIFSVQESPVLQCHKMQFGVLISSLQFWVSDERCLLQAWYK